MLRRLRCPHCGAPLTRHSGPRLPPLKQRMFNTIRNTGDHGITSRDLLSLIYENRRKPKHLANIRCHISQINDLLAETDWRIVTHDRRHWILTNLNQPKPAPSDARRREATPARPRSLR